VWRATVAIRLQRPGDCSGRGALFVGCGEKFPRTLRVAGRDARSDELETEHVRVDLACEAGRLDFSRTGRYHPVRG
jgi:hypothetical protein